jgi:hypothetical protein
MKIFYNFIKNDKIIELLLNKLNILNRFNIQVALAEPSIVHRVSLDTLDVHPI